MVIVLFVGGGDLNEFHIYIWHINIIYIPVVVVVVIVVIIDVVVDVHDGVYCEEDEGKEGKCIESGLCGTTCVPWSSCSQRYQTKDIIFWSCEEIHNNIKIMA